MCVGLKCFTAHLVQDKQPLRARRNIIRPAINALFYLHSQSLSGGYFTESLVLTAKVFYAFYFDYAMVRSMLQACVATKEEVYTRLFLNMPLPHQVPGVLSHAWPQHRGYTGVPPPQTPRLQLQSRKIQTDSDYTQGEQGQSGLLQGSP